MSNLMTSVLAPDSVAEQPFEVGLAHRVGPRPSGLAHWAGLLGQGSVRARAQQSGAVLAGHDLQGGKAKGNCLAQWKRRGGGSVLPTKPVETQAGRQ